MNLIDSCHEEKSKRWGKSCRKNSLHSILVFVRNRGGNLTAIFPWKKCQEVEDCYNSCTQWAIFTVQDSTREGRRQDKLCRIIIVAVQGAIIMTSFLGGVGIHWETCKAAQDVADFSCRITEKGERERDQDLVFKRKLGNLISVTEPSVGSFGMMRLGNL